MQNLLDFFVHLDSHLFTMIIDYGPWVYGILFLMIFIETGLVILPFVPGDSLLFAAGTFCAGVQNEMGETANLNLYIVLFSLILAAVLGDSLNYYLGNTVGVKILSWKLRGKNLVNEKYIERTKTFFEKHGPKTIIIARFVPIIRTFAPFVAGIGDMHYGKFIRFNIIGGTVWVVFLLFTGYFFGNLPFVKNNFEFVILGIVAVSMIPVGIQFFRK
ncbi:VTT domain-containing protein [Aequorivita sp. CIP111184]|uniref:VTT domain-containing protein n=1 Tax=Aequorivita sp. CIP111184 TaxID=2211356 RepID=UPI000DBC0A02|nr:VTT domain-containing protein [Aequorivita sp. CIP111184]SRX54844.1 putative membrane protein [Aequorivita sp. CIP111184]